MASEPQHAAAARRGFAPSLTAFLGDFARYAGRQGAVAALLVGAGAVFESVGIVLLVPILGVVAGGKPGGGGALRSAAERTFAAIGAQTPLQRLAVLLAAFGALMLLRAIVIGWRDVRLAQLQIGFLEAQRGTVAELLAEARWDQLTRLRHARITHLLSGEIQRVSACANFMLQAGVAVVMLAAQCVLAFLLAPGLALIAFALLAVMALALIPMVRRSQRLGEFVTGANLALLDSATQFLGGLKLAVSQNLQGAFTREFRESLGALTQRQVDNVRQRTQGRLALNLLSSAVGAAILLIGFGWLHTPASVLITLLLIISRMGGPVGQLQQGLQQVAAALPAYDKLAELKDELAAARELRPARASARFPEGAVVFDRVSFHHSEEAEAGGVENLSLSLAPGAFVGVTGPTGAGKTTFADLLAGLYAPHSGQITVGGSPLVGETLAAWRAGLAYVSQDPFLFHDSVRRNLAWAGPDASEAEMWSALELTEAAVVVRRMAQGLDTVVGERGALVSGGERQRIALARALLRRPRLLLLDEATNAIDIPAEQRLLTALAALSPRPTIVLIAHRPESLAACETVLVFQAGRLAPAASEHLRSAASGG
ncbi:MAG TPA: ABC transporter ATP-binding protein [Caulobacteraceae bacterium]|nr:ABC transporter ATP-binding protein [Caulobacteraceae bacterium]